MLKLLMLHILAIIYGGDMVIYKQKKVEIPNMCEGRVIR